MKQWNTEQRYGQYDKSGVRSWWLDPKHVTTGPPTNKRKPAKQPFTYLMKTSLWRKGGGGGIVTAGHGGLFSMMLLL